MLQERLAVINQHLAATRASLNPVFLGRVVEGINTLEQNMPEAAESYFESAVKADPKSPLARELWAYSFLAQKGESKKITAIEILGNVTYLAPNADSYRSLAYAIAEFGKYHPYLALLHHAMDHQPDDDLLIRMGRIAVTQDISGQTNNDLTKKVKRAMYERKLYVNLTPL